MYEIVFVWTVNMFLLANIGEGKSTQMDTAEQSLGQILFDLVVFTTQQGYQKENLEREVLFPFLNLLIGKSRNTDFRTRIENVVRLNSLSLKFGFSELSELKTNVSSNPKPQTGNIFASSQKATGLLTRSKGTCLC